MSTVGYEPILSERRNNDTCSWCRHKPDTDRSNWVIPDADNRLLTFGRYRCYLNWSDAYRSWKQSGYRQTDPEILDTRSNTCAGYSE